MYQKLSYPFKDLKFYLTYIFLLRNAINNLRIHICKGNTKIVPCKKVEIKYNLLEKNVSQKYIKE